MKLFSALFLLGVTLALVAGHPYNFPQNGNSDQPQEYSPSDGGEQIDSGFQPYQSESDGTEDHSFTDGSDHEVPQESYPQSEYSPSDEGTAGDEQIYPGVQPYFGGDSGAQEEPQGESEGTGEGSAYAVPLEGTQQSEPEFGSPSETYQPQYFGNRQRRSPQFSHSDVRQDSAPIPTAIRDHGIPAHFDSVDEGEASLNETESDQDKDSKFLSPSETHQPQFFGNRQRRSPQFSHSDVRQDSAPIPTAIRDHEIPAHFDSVDEGEATLNETESDQDEDSKFRNPSETHQPQFFGNRQRRSPQFSHSDDRQDSAHIPTAIRDHGIPAHFDSVDEGEASLNETESDQDEDSKFGSPSETHQPQFFGNRQRRSPQFSHSDVRQDSAPIPTAIRDHGIPAHFDSVDEGEASLNETESDQDEDSKFGNPSETHQPQFFGNRQRRSAQFSHSDVRQDSAPIPTAIRDHGIPSHFDSVDEGEASLNETESDQDEDSKFGSPSETHQPQFFGNRQRRSPQFSHSDVRQDSAPIPTAIRDHEIPAHFDSVDEGEASLNETESYQDEDSKFGSPSETHQPQFFGNRQRRSPQFSHSDVRQDSAPIPTAIRDHEIPSHFDSVDEGEASLNETESDQDEDSKFGSPSETHQPQFFGNRQRRSPQFSHSDVRQDSAPIPTAIRDHGIPAHFDSVDEGEASLNETESDQDEDSKFGSPSETHQPQFFGNRQRRSPQFSHSYVRQDSAPIPTAIRDHGIPAHFDSVDEGEASLNETESDQHENNEKLSKFHVPGQ